jgi:hypothetical protein
MNQMPAIESDTIIYLRSLLATCAVDDPDVATFLACWVYEETFHGLALQRFLAATDSPLGARPLPRGQEPWAKRLEAAATERPAGRKSGGHGIRLQATLTGV